VSRRFKTTPDSETVVDGRPQPTQAVCAMGLKSLGIYSPFLVFEYAIARSIAVLPPGPKCFARFTVDGSFVNTSFMLRWSALFTSSRVTRLLGLVAIIHLCGLFERAPWVGRRSRLYSRRKIPLHLSELLG